MLESSIGIIIGLLIALLLLVIEIRLDKKKQPPLLQSVIKPIEKLFRPRGAIYMPKDDAELAREEIIRKNNENGASTTLEELQS